MTSIIYRFPSLFWTLLGPPVAAFILYDLACFFGTSRGASWVESLHCPGSEAISCHDLPYWYCIGAKVIFLILMIGASTYRRCVALDGNKKKMQWWHLFYGMPFWRKGLSLSGITEVLLVRRQLETERLVRGLGPTKVTYSILEFAGSRRIEIQKFGLGKNRARRIGREIANLLEIPFVDGTQGSAFKDPMVISRQDVEEVLRRWQRGEMTAAEVVKWSEDHHPDEGFRYADVNWDDWERGKAESIINEVMLEIEDMGEDLLIKENIPIFLDFLHSSPGEFLNAQKRFKAALEDRLTQKGGLK